MREAKRRITFPEALLPAMFAAGILVGEAVGYAAAWCGRSPIWGALVFAPVAAYAAGCLLAWRKESKRGTEGGGDDGE